MESILAIGVGLVLRIVIDFATENDDRVGAVVVGLWEGVVLNHFVQRMPRSFDPYLGLGFRIFVDFLFTQSLSRLALVSLWALVGMLLADIAPNFWRDSGLRHLYRQVRKDVRHVKRSVPRIRIENDLPSVRLFSKSRSTSLEASNSVRSDRAALSRSPAPSSAPAPVPARRPGRSPPGTFPDVSGWSETGTDISDVRARVVTLPAPSPSLIPSRENTVHERIDATRTTHVATSQIQKTTTVQNIAITITQSQNESVSLETPADAAPSTATAATTSPALIDDISRHDLPAIPDDWVDINHPMSTRSNVPVAPFQPDPDSTPEPQPALSTLTQSRPASTLDPPPEIDVLPDIPDVDHVSRTSQPPDQIPLPESRAASVIGGVFDQPRPRSALRDSRLSRVDKATTELGVDPATSYAPLVDTQPTKSHSTSRSRTPLPRSKLKDSVEADAPERPPKESCGQPALRQGKPDVGGAAQSSGSQICTPAQVDPVNILTHPSDPPSLLLTSQPEARQQQGQFQAAKHDPMASSVGVDCSPAPPQGGEVPSSSLSSTGIPEFSATGDDRAREAVARDNARSELTEEQKAAEEKRRAFLLSQVKVLEGSRFDLRTKLDREDDPTGSCGIAIQSDLQDMEKTLESIKIRLVKRRFDDPPPKPLIKEVALAEKSIAEAQFAVTSAVLKLLLERDDAGPMVVQVTMNKQKMKARPKEMRDAITNFAKRHQFTTRNEGSNIIITF